MYESYWNLNEKPFKNTPDPKYIYLSSQHEEALARLKYGISEHLGCVVLSGVFGCGKTLLLKTLFNESESAKYKIGYITNPQLNSTEILKTVIYELGYRENIPEDKSSLLQMINKIITDNNDDGKQTVIVVDEAHVIENLETFEELRMLLNFQKDDRFMISLILSGQPELSQKVSNVKQLAQRVGIKASLDKLGFEDMKAYINHRLLIAGSEKEVFDEKSLKIIFENSGGIPRRINSICDLALLTGFTRKQEYITKDIIDEIIVDLV